MHEVLVNRLGGLSLPRKSVVRLTDRLDMTLDVYRGRKTTKQQQQQQAKLLRQGYRYHKLRKAFSKFYRRHFDIMSKYNVGLKTLLLQGLSEPELMGVTRKTEIHPMTEIRRNTAKNTFVFLEYL